ncbi:hypothetical protein BVRB_3g059360 [Beta vulgaris subsp. vulgaris]|nr:hypothetical protein BVRB_3g059360 [Beta vulgaris subsp. vulgaris]
MASLSSIYISSTLSTSSSLTSSSPASFSKILSLIESPPPFWQILPVLKIRYQQGALYARNKPGGGTLLATSRLFQPWYHTGQGDYLCVATKSSFNEG